MSDWNVIIYDLEIIKGIPGKTTIPRLQYCKGWNDFENMGISVGAYAWRGKEDVEAFYWEDEAARKKFIEAMRIADIVAGFNSLSFDDKLLAANGVEVRTNYDVLLEVRLAAYGSLSWKDQPDGDSYRLADIVAANNMEKTGSGNQAPIDWQTGKRDKVLAYCRNDARIERNTLNLLLEGGLKNPNDQGYLQGRELSAYAYDGL